MQEPHSKGAGGGRAAHAPLARRRWRAGAAHLSPLFSPLSSTRAAQVFWRQCKPMYAFSERIADWLMHGYHADEICSKLRMCIPGFFDDKE